jgi:hypothetical protein
MFAVDLLPQGHGLDLSRHKEELRLKRTDYFVFKFLMEDRNGCVCSHKWKTHY